MSEALIERPSQTFPGIDRRGHKRVSQDEAGNTKKGKPKKKKRERHVSPKKKKKKPLTGEKTRIGGGNGWVKGNQGKRAVTTALKGRPHISPVHQRGKTTTRNG